MLGYPRKRESCNVEWTAHQTPFYYAPKASNLLRSIIPRNLSVSPNLPFFFFNQFSVNNYSQSYTKLKPKYTIKSFLQRTSSFLHSTTFLLPFGSTTPHSVNSSNTYHSLPLSWSTPKESNLLSNVTTANTLLESLPPQLPLFLTMFVTGNLVGHGVVVHWWSPKVRLEASSCLISLVYGTLTMLLASLVLVSDRSSASLPPSPCSSTLHATWT